MQVSQEEMAEVCTILQAILANNDVERKAAEAKLATAKTTSADKYAILLCSMSHPSNAQVPVDVKQLACVILYRCNCCTNNVICQSFNSQVPTVFFRCGIETSGQMAYS